MKGTRSQTTSFSKSNGFSGQVVPSKPAGLESCTTSCEGKFFKTKLCAFWLSGQCNRGSRCTYAHNEHELKPRPDLAKTSMCFQMQRHGFCNKARCKFAHYDEELRAVEEGSSLASCSSRDEKKIDYEYLQDREGRIGGDVAPSEGGHFSSTILGSCSSSGGFSSQSKYHTGSSRSSYSTCEQSVGSSPPEVPFWMRREAPPAQVQAFLVGAQVLIDAMPEYYED
mmetsp:Transcript_4027/g.9431  ORF Transcript_4027/g.9431 Transcript_4027/m.9431 type:complete len:225 (-) Transcript_4027:118-792(-)|eukprot:CAMPEP_0170605146 /NCGR_PEP_ID=MMETSP0224-20130122/19818_1 /TAXON_ID=285029 /ORGANISM="Togula jolla, Strain CCCM 725" /LENGTH=224 /DNA_ID=CAMNT_0010930131 /DNA_START=84 /DNA_END=758 /DNA_ORIENTATION=+